MSSHRVEDKIALVPIFEQSTPLTLPNFNPEYDEDHPLDIVAEQRVLVVGAGALGCDALKCLVMSGYEDITIVDMDTIELSNLNRQFMFRVEDIGDYKANVAAKFLQTRRPEVKVHTQTKKIQELGKHWISQFSSVILCLDNNEARLWISEALVDIVQFEPHTMNFIELINESKGHLTPSPDQRTAFQRTNKPILCPIESIHPLSLFEVEKFKNLPHPIMKTGYECLGVSLTYQNLFNQFLPALPTNFPSPEPMGSPPSSNRPLNPIVYTTPSVKPSNVVNYYEGGTEGWLGHYRALRPLRTFCLKCFPEAKVPNKAELHTHLCTIANVPRIPEHCIMYAHQLLWPKLIFLHSREDYEMVPPREAPSSTAPPRDNTQDDPNEQYFDSTSDPAGVEFDADNIDHIYWCLDRATERAMKYNITSPTYAQTLGVIKNTIPAISSTNSLIASLCVNASFKYETEAMNPFSPGDYFTRADELNGFQTNFISNLYTTGIGIPTAVRGRAEDCTVCTPRTRICAHKDTLAFLPILGLILSKWYKNDVDLIHEPLSFEIKDVYHTNNPLLSSVAYFRASASPNEIMKLFDKEGKLVENMGQKELLLGQLSPDLVNLLKPINSAVFQPITWVGTMDGEEADQKVHKVFQIIDLSQNNFAPIKFEFQMFD